MSKGPSAPIYPAYTFNDSRTWFNWVKLTAADIHGLAEHPGFEGQNIYFHLNHPIRYVCLTGLVVSIEDMKSKYTLLEVDDGSGRVITVKITRLPADMANTADCPSNTTIANVDVNAAVGRYEVLVDKRSLDIGTVVKVKCTISSFRNVRQLELKRIWVLRSTVDEIAEWEEGARFKRDVLCRPWVVTRERLRELQMAEVEKRRKREEADRMAERMRRHEDARKARRIEKRREHDLRKEAKRKKEEEIMNAGALI